MPLRRGAPALALALLMTLHGGLAFAAGPVFRSASSSLNQATAALLDMPVPTGTAVGDLLIVACETNGNITLNASNWTEVACSPIPNTSTELSVYYRTAQAADVDGTCEVCDTDDSGNHQFCLLMAVEAGTWDAATPIDACDSATEASGTSFTSDNTASSTVPSDSLVVLAVGNAANRSQIGIGHGVIVVRFRCSFLCNQLVLCRCVRESIDVPVRYKWI